MSVLRGRPKPYRIVLESLPIDVRVAIEAAMDNGEVVVVEDRLGVTMTEIIKTEDKGA